MRRLKFLNTLAKAFSDVGNLRFLPLIEGDRFGVIPHMYKGVTEIRLVPQLIEVQADQAPPDQNGKHRAHQRVAEHHADQQNRFGPENPGKGNQVHEGAENDEEKGQGGAGKRTDVLHDALIGVVDL